MRFNPNLQFTVVEPSKGSLANFVEMLKQTFYNLVIGLNGHIGFGDGTNRDNIDGNWADVTTPVAPNTDFTVTHNLGRVPVGYLIMRKDRAVDIYDGSIPPTETDITLRATVASAVVKLFIFCLVLATSAFAQTTTVNVNVTDTGGIVWSGGNYRITWVANPANPGADYMWQGSLFDKTQVFQGYLDASGNFTVSLPDNSTITPVGSSWSFYVCPAVTAPCYTQPIGVSGPSMSLSITPPALLISPTPLQSVYETPEGKGSMGGLIYRANDGHVYVCAVKAAFRIDPTVPCTNWIPLCEPGDLLCGGGGGGFTTYQHNGVDVGTQPKLNFIDTGTVTFALVNDSGNSRVNVQATASGGGGGTGCILSGIDTGVLLEHPAGTCFDSIKHTWDPTNEILLIGDGTATATPNVTEAFDLGAFNVFQDIDQAYILGDASNVKGISGGGSVEAYSIGDSNNLERNSSEVYNFGFNNKIRDTVDENFTIGGGNIIQSQTSTVQANISGCMTIGDVNFISSATGAHTLSDCILQGTANTLIVSGTSTVDSVAVVGSDNQIAATTANEMSGLFILGELNHINNTLAITDEVVIAGESNEVDGSISTVQIFGFRNVAHNASAQAISTVNTTLVGSANTATNTGLIGTDAYQGVFGGLGSITNCTGCWVFGEHVTNTTNDTMAVGMSTSTTPALIIQKNGTADNLIRTPHVFSYYPTCAAGTEGSIAAITDSTSNTWGATITGGGTNHVLGYCNGTNWTVMAK